MTDAYSMSAEPEMDGSQGYESQMMDDGDENVER